MPTVLLLDVSLSMSRPVSGGTQSSPVSDADTYRQLAIRGINAMLDYLATNNKLEFVSLVIFSSLYQQVVPFTRDFSEIRNALGKLEEFNKTSISVALAGVDQMLTDEWGCTSLCRVILITDGCTGIGEGSLAQALGSSSQGSLSRFGYQLYVACITDTKDPAWTRSETLFQRLVAEAAASGDVFVPEGQLCERSVQQMFLDVCDKHYAPYTGTLCCGNMRCPVHVFPAPENYCRECEFERVEKTVSKELEICGFIEIKDIANSPHISRHLVLPLPLTSSPMKSEAHSTDIKSEVDGSEEKDVDKLAAFTVLLHGSLKVEQMVAIVQIGEDWYGMMYSFADSKKKSNLMLSVFEPGDRTFSFDSAGGSCDCLPWLGNLNKLGPSAEFSVPPYGDDSQSGQSPFPVVPAERRSYVQNCVVWIKSAGLQADVQKILRSAKRLPEKQQLFYKELNRLRSAALALGFYELLDAAAKLLERECTMLPESAHPDAALQMTHAINFLRHAELSRDATRHILPLRTNYATGTTSATASTD